MKDEDRQVITADNYTVTYKGNTDAGTAAATVTFDGRYYEGSKDLSFVIGQADNPLDVKGRTAKVKYKKLKKKSWTLTASKVITFVQEGQGEMSYKLISAKKGKKSFKKKFKVNAGTGKVTVRKGLKKGTYKVKVEVKAAGNANYEPSTVKTVTFKVKVK